MKKTIKLIVLIAISLFFVACGSNKKSNESSEQEESSQESSSVESIKNVLRFTDLEDGIVLENTTIGKYTIAKDSEIETKAGTATDGAHFSNKKVLKINDQKDALTFVMDSDGNMEIYVSDGSTTNESPTFTIVDLNGNIIKKDLKIDNTIERFDLDLPMGVYKIYGDSTIRIWWAVMTVTVEESEINGFYISNYGKVDYIEGQGYDSSNLKVYASFESGKVELLNSNEYTIDSSAFISSTPGTYQIKVSYKDFEDITFNCVVYKVTGVKCYTWYMEDGEDTYALNGTRVKKEADLIYNIGQTLSTEALASNLVFQVSAYNVDTMTDKKFVLNYRSQYSLQSDDYNEKVAGTYTLKASARLNGTYYEDTINIYVISSSLQYTDGAVTLYVGKSNLASIGGYYKGCNYFESISLALDFIKNFDLDDSVKKIIYIASGTYNEKVEITIPNLVLIGESVTDTIITYSAASGLADPLGEEYQTEGSATVSIRDTALNFEAHNITFENYYNSFSRYNSLKNIVSSSKTQAVALLCQTDMAIFQNCHFNGYHNTLYLYTGRYYFNSCYISGATDYILATNSTAYFTKCTINSIYTGQNTNGGYIVASKGNNKGSDDTKYGLIFNECYFTGDNNITSNTTSLARPWGEYARVVIMNSALGGHISTTGYQASVYKGLRYVGGLSKFTPITSSVNFLEYNNTGLGSISTAVTGMRFMKETEASYYSNFDYIFEAVEYTTAGLELSLAKWNIELISYKFIS